MASTTKSSFNIILYRGWKDPGYVWSPFVTKLETRLRFAGLSYKAEAGSPLTGPRGKIPYIKISGTDREPELMGDSAQIIERFVSEERLPDLNARLGPAEKVYDVALRALLEEKLYFYQVNHTRASWQNMYKSNLENAGLREMARELLRHARSLSRLHPIPHPNPHRYARIQENDGIFTWTRYGTILWPRDCWLSREHMEEYQ